MDFSVIPPKNRVPHSSSRKYSGQCRVDAELKVGLTVASSDKTLERKLFSLKTSLLLIEFLLLHYWAFKSPGRKINVQSNHTGLGKDLTNSSS